MSAWWCCIMGDNKYHVGSVLVRNIGKYLTRIAGYVRRRYLEHHAGHRAIYIKTIYRKCTHLW